MKLIFLGGVKGVGKSTLLDWLVTEYKQNIRLIDAGEMFRKYHYNHKLKSTDEVEEMIIRKIVRLPDNAIIVIHWHYAVIQPNCYVPQISFDKLRRLATNYKIQEVFLLLVKAPLDLILERRLRTLHSKKRSLSIKSIREEISEENYFLRKHLDIFKDILGSKVKVIKLVNADLRKAKKDLLSIFQQLIP